MENNLLKNKRILIVDDEPDIIDSLEELLSMCILSKASNFDEGKKLLEMNDFDLAILDIMGVNGYKLLEIALKRKVITVMLTAHALSPKDTVKSFKEGAASYIPKDKLFDIKTYLNDIFEAKEKGESFQWRWLKRLGAYYDKHFGKNWKDSDKDFWDKFGYYV